MITFFLLPLSFLLWTPLGWVWSSGRLKCRWTSSKVTWIRNPVMSQSPVTVNRFVDRESTFLPVKWWAMLESKWNLKRPFSYTGWGHPLLLSPSVSHSYPPPMMCTCGLFIWCHKNAKGQREGGACFTGAKFEMWKVVHNIKWAGVVEKTEVPRTWKMA